MRLTVNDSGFATYRLYLDGKPITHCVEADEEQGYVKRYVLDESGHPRDDTHTHTAQYEILRGKVELRHVVTPYLLFRDSSIWPFIGEGIPTWHGEGNHIAVRLTLNPATEGKEPVHMEFTASNCVIRGIIEEVLPKKGVRWRRSLGRTLTLVVMSPQSATVDGDPPDQ